jgi:hypothetical protein
MLVINPAKIPIPIGRSWLVKNEYQIWLTVPFDNGDYRGLFFDFTYRVSTVWIPHEIYASTSDRFHPNFPKTGSIWVVGKRLLLLPRCFEQGLRNPKERLNNAS